MSRKSQIITRKNVKYSSTMVQALATLEGKVKKDVLRPSVYEGIQLLYRMLKQNTPEGTDTMSKTPGLLRNSIYRWHNDKRSNETQQWYAVGINMKKAPHWHLVEYGHWQPFYIYKNKQGQWRTSKRRRETPKWTPAYPFLRNTFMNGEPLAMATIREEIAERLQIAVKQSRTMP